MAKRLGRAAQTYTTNEQIARRVYRALKTASDGDRTTDPILAFHFSGREDYVLLRCNKELEISIKGKEQTAGEVKFFAYSDFRDQNEKGVIFNLKDDLDLIELYGKGAIRWPSISLTGSTNPWSSNCAKPSAILPASLLKDGFRLRKR